MSFLMGFLPKISLRRTMIIAQRDFFGYIKTWGFWLSFFLPFIIIVIGAGIGLAANTFKFDVTPVRYETVLDTTGRHGQALQDSHLEQMKAREKEAIIALKSIGLLPEADIKAIEDIYATQGIDGVKTYVTANTPITRAQIDKALSRVEIDLIFVKPPADTLEGLMPYLRGEKKIMVDDQSVSLGGALIISAPKDATSELPNVQYWSPNFNNPRVKFMAETYFRERAETKYLASGGLNTEDLRSARQIKPFQTFDPTKTQGTDENSQAVTVSDRLPYIVAGAMSIILWLTIFSGSYMLLTSMLEEKLNMLLEMMLASTRFSEVIFGKLIGVAAITLLAMAPYLIMGAAAIGGYILFGSDNEIINGLIRSFSPKIMIFFIIYLLLGYLFYGAFFVALGALSQSMQDAQTLTTPIVMILTLCVLIVPYGVQNPDSPLLTFASLFPLSAPFAAMIRLPSDPPLWELILSAGFLALITLGVIALASRLFRYGVLSGSGVELITGWIKRVIFRRKGA